MAFPAVQTRPTVAAKKRGPVLLALGGSFLLTVLIIVGSRNLEHYDAALFGYTIASVVAFGKLFHVVQRPASIGVELYRERAREMEQAKCARCGSEFVSQLWLDDLKTVVDKLGFDYSMDDGHTLQDYCPRCKRIMRGLAYANLPTARERVFGGSRLDN